MLSLLRAQVQLLVGEQRSYRLHVVAKKKKKNLRKKKKKNLEI